MGCCYYGSDKLLRKQIEVSLGAIADEIRQLRFVLSRPGRMGIRVVKTEEGNMKAVVTLPGPSGAKDWGSRELLVSVAGGEQVAVAVEPKEAPESSEFVFADYGQSAHLELTDIDVRGNRGETTMQDVEITDNIGPPKPGEMGIRVTSEDAEPTPDPTQEPFRR